MATTTQPNIKGLKEEYCVMSKISKKFFLVPLTLFLMFAMLFSLIGCGKEAPMTADIEVILLDKNDIPIANTEILVDGISDMEIMQGYMTDPDGRSTIKRLGERTITVIIHAETNSFKASYAVTKRDLEQGEITIRFDDYEI